MAGLTLTRLVAGAAVLLLVAGPLAVQAQPAAKVFRISLLGTVPLTQPGASRIWGGFFEGLRQLGYVEGQNIVIEGPILGGPDPNDFPPSRPNWFGSRLT